ncbi:patatin-like phospholipase family protein [Marinobacter sp. C2H3]|uniref:patatin-like phospholipase family protein n=1 Tax=Marinobacter sp. C2H3 TaxID=3119003 RepID=UPI00300ECA04
MIRRSSSRAPDVRACLWGLVCLAALTLGVAPALSAAAAGGNDGRTGDVKARPMVALVLSGGGAKGMAHVGVLRVLEEMHVPVDLVVGTSAGSAVGALYASGMPVAEIERRFMNLDWLSSFRDDPGRVYKPIRRKESEWRFPLAPGLGLRADGVHVGGGLVAGQNLGFILNELTEDATLVDDFDRLPIRFRAVATDLATGEPVVIGHGNLADAIRASMSIPGVYSPVERNGRVLVDGGIANNLPISVARDLGADVIIAVDITDPLSDPDQLREAFSVVGQLTTLLTRRNTDQQLDLLGPGDVRIHPDLEGLTSSDFYQAPLLFEIGATATRRHAVALHRLSVSSEAWAAYRSRLATRRVNDGAIARVEIDTPRNLARDFLRERIRQQPGEPLDVPALQEDLKRIYGLGYHETVSYSLLPSPDGPVLRIRPAEKSWGPNYLAFGLNYEDNVDGDTHFNLASALRVTELNRLGGEWQTGVQLGTDPWIRTQWYQPLAYGYDRFLILGGQYSRTNVALYEDTEQVAEVDVGRRSADLGVGMELGGNAEVRLTYVRGYATVDKQIGGEPVPDNSVNSGSLQLRLVHDSLDDASYPTSGGFAGLRARFERPGLGSDRRFDSVTSLLMASGDWRGLSVTGLLFAEDVLKGEAGIENQVRLGGFRRLSAYAPGQITGTSAAMAAVYARQRFGGPIVPWFAGTGLEAGNAWDSLGEASWTDSVKSVSVFAGVDTFFGPVQAAAAYNSAQDWTAYLNVGFTFTQLFYE